MEKLGKRIHVKFKISEKEELEKDWKPLRSLTRKKRMGWVGDWFEAFGKKYTITNISGSKVHEFALPIELEEAEIKRRVHSEISNQAWKNVKPEPTIFGTAPVIGITSPSERVYDEIRNLIKRDDNLSFEDNFRKAMEVAYRYAPSEWYDTTTFANLVFEARRGNETASKLCGMR